MNDQPNALDIVNYLRLVLEPGMVVELRVLGVVDDPRYPKFAVSGYFDHDHLNELARAAIEWTNKAEGCYVTINPVDTALLARAANRMVRKPKNTTGDPEVSRRTGLVFDFDPTRPAGVSATDAEKALALSRMSTLVTTLTTSGWPDPIMSDSGNGGHARYRIDLPNDDASRDLVKRVLEAADALLSDDLVKVDTSMSNASRIVKAPGTLARKGDSTPDRPHRLSKILRVPTHIQVVPVERLEAFANEHQPAPKPAASNGPSRGTGFQKTAKKRCEPRDPRPRLRILAWVPGFHRW